MKKKNKHSSPMQYRIVYRSGNSVMKSTQYYSVYHSSEALEDIYHTYRKGKIHAREITIYRIQEYNRFTDKWENRIEEAIKNAEGIGMIALNSGKIILKKKGGVK